MNVLMLTGSFRASSYSLGLLRAVMEEWTQHQCQIWPVQQLPFYCEDDDGVDKPASVQAFLAAVKQADAIVVCSPEYNHSIPAVLKNAIDWASRPAFRSPLKDKPVTIITQAVSPVGGARAQAHLKLVLDSTLSRIHLCHEMMVAAVDQKFDADMNLVDPKTRDRLRRHLDDFIRFIG